jgi:catechol 2,3-dioxygenase-like lactoylglutathione lyase family enzyme
MRIDHVGLLVGDLEAGKALARDVLGLGDAAAEFQAAEHGLAGAFFGMGDARLEVFTIDGAPAERLAAGAAGALDHIAVQVDDLDAERERLAGHGVRFTGPSTPEHIDEPVVLRGSRHLWTDPATSGGIRIQLIQPGR